MKKIFTKLLILAIVSAILSMLICFFSINNVRMMEPSEEIVGGIKDVDQDSATAGYEILARLAGGGATFFLAIFAVMFALLIPGSMFGIIIILQIIARLVQIGVEKDWKNTTSKICAYISIAIYIILCLMFLTCLTITIFSYKILFVVALNIYCIVAFIKILSGENIWPIKNKIDENN